MNKYKFKRLWNYLENNTENFSPRINSFEEVWKCIERQQTYYSDKNEIAILTFLVIFNNHYMINGNKRLAFGLYHLIKDGTYQDIKPILKILEKE